MGDFKEKLIKVLKTEPDTSRTAREESENKDYLKQIADDIHLIKIVVIAFAAVSILTTLFTLIYLANIFSHF